MIRLLKCFAAIILFLTCVPPAFALHVRVEPGAVSPGDAFLVRLSGMDSSGISSVSIEGEKIPLSGCGDGCAFGIGVVGIDTAPGEKLVVVHSGSDRVTQPLSILAPNFPEMKLRLPKSKVILSPENIERVKREEAMMNEIWQRTTPRLFKGDFILPLPNPVSAVFGAKRIMNNTTISIHRGIDLKGKQGEAIKAANDGRVVLEKETFFGGNTLIIDHGSGVYTVYMHLERFLVKSGDLVAKGDVVGSVGHTGRATGPHLHFGVKILTVNANPLSLMHLHISE